MNRYKLPLRVLMSAFVIVAGTLHFLSPAPFIKIVPDYLPAPALLVYVSGFFEILGGIGLLIPPLRRAAAWGLVALFIAVFPANVNMAVNDIVLQGIPHIPLLYWLRLPLQAVLIAWAWWLSRPEADPGAIT
ncbi:MAG: DoxX family membrane protein [Aphanocapsa lilacina HA4352-LM1]|nr:DoxX family membrane protein [Aphanocapsa lilacina HA4352-LM1]